MDLKLWTVQSADRSLIELRLYLQDEAFLDGLLRDDMPSFRHLSIWIHSLPQATRPAELYSA